MLTSVRKRKFVWQLTDVLRGWQHVNWTLILLISLSILVTHRYKASYALLPDGHSRPPGRP